MFAQKVLEAGGPFPSTSVRENGHQGQCSVVDLVLRLQTRTGGLSQPLEIKITSSRQALWAVFQHWPLDLWMQRFVFADDPPLIISIAMSSVFNLLCIRESETTVSTLGTGRVFDVGKLCLCLFCFPSKVGWMYQ